MEDRQLLLAKQDYAGTREMLRRVGILGVDTTKSFSVVAIGEALAYLTGLRITCRQSDGTMKIFNILAGEAPSAVPGPSSLVFRKASVVVPKSDIVVTNNGIKGMVYMKVTDDVGSQKYYLEGIVDAGAILSHPVDIVIDMPKRDYGLVVEVGH